MKLPPVGLGTMGIEDPAVVTAALKLGYRHLDTAQIYENESVVGEGLAEADVSRAAVTVATKLWVDQLDGERVPQATRDSAARLGIDTIDLLYVHRPRGAYDPATTLPALDELRAAGVIEQIGVSNFEIEALDRAIDTLAAPLVAHQTELHPLWYRPELLAHAREHGYTVVAYSPLAGGRVRSIDAVSAVAASHDTTPEAVAIAWANTKDPVVTIPKASSERHLRANLDAAALELTADEVAAIDAIDREQELFPD